MADMLVRLYDLDEYIGNGIEVAKGYKIVCPLTASKGKVLEFIFQHFGQGWRDEAEVCFSRLPVTVFVATNEQKEIVGFACVETTGKGFFGPTGVRPDMRGKGLGKALLLTSLKALREMGYAYAFIGSAATTAIDFYKKSCGAITIEGSEVSIYRNLV